MKRGWFARFCWLGVVLLGTIPAGAQPEEERPAREAAAIRDLKEALEKREQALAEANRRLRELEAQLREQRMQRGQEPEGPWRAGPVVRVFPVTPALQAAGAALEPLGKLPEARLVVLPTQLVVWGPAPAVEALTRVLTALDPALQPQPVTLMARLYLAAEELPPNLTAPPEDPLLPQLQERTGHKNVGLLTALDLPGIEGGTCHTEHEMRVQGEWGELGGTLRLTSTPHLVGKQQVQMNTHIQAEWMLGPGGLRRLRYEGILRTPVGKALLLVSDDPFSHSALVLALAPFVAE